MSDSLQPHRLQPAGLLGPWNFPDKNTGVGCHFLLQMIFQTQGLNPCLLSLLRWQADFSTTEPPGKPMEQYTRPFKTVLPKAFLKSGAEQLTPFYLLLQEIGGQFSPLARHANPFLCQSVLSPHLMVSAKGTPCAFQKQIGSQYSIFFRSIMKPV